jgi:dihydroneopterin aldolase
MQSDIAGQLTVSLHAIRIHAPHGLYEKEGVWGNVFEVDVDARVMASAGQEWPFINYGDIHAIVEEVFARKVPLLEDLVGAIHAGVREAFPALISARVAVRKLRPPVAGDVAYSQVVFEG